MSRTVLIVDDHPSFRASARAMLESEGFDVVGEAADGASALEAVDALAPDVVLLDVQLPDMTGFDVCAELERRNGATARGDPRVESRRRPTTASSSPRRARAASSPRASSPATRRRTPRLSRVSIPELVVALQSGAPLRDALAGALRDEELTVVYWLDQRQGTSRGAGSTFRVMPRRSRRPPRAER